MPGVRRRTISLTVVAVAAGVALAGCSGGASGQSSSSAGAPAVAPPEAAAGGGTADSKAGAPAAGTDQVAKAPDLRVDQRSIIYTGSITIRVDDVNSAAAKATAIADGAGGFVGGDKRNITGGASDATLELRVPAEKFQSVVDQLARTLGTEEQRGISTEDVTEQTVDLDARIAVQQARVDSGRRLLARAKTLNDLVMLEREVATRESDLASLQAKKRRLADLTTLSTITVVLLAPKAAATPPKEGRPASGWLRGRLEGLGRLARRAADRARRSAALAARPGHPGRGGLLRYSPSWPPTGPDDGTRWRLTAIPQPPRSWSCGWRRAG